MSDRRASVFLEHQSYRRRRVIDTIRILPVVGALLWGVPLLWPRDSSEGIATSNAVIYLFSVWCALVIMGALMARAVSKGGVDENQRDP
ncbi:hypothetical protein ACMAZE_11000 [Pseudopelagicola sp. nBUS_20]|uniref:hypothetical protein n=1 Tax=Pseudopelagicola sp. nBUS_20 TaxID=3395317 RepID=UPI003EB81C1C